jgi:hypothetical protein
MERFTDVRNTKVKSLARDILAKKKLRWPKTVTST